MFNVINKVTADDNQYMKDWGEINSLMYQNGMTYGTVLEPTQESGYSEEEWCQYVIISLLQMPKSQFLETQKISTNLFNMLQEVVQLFNSYPTKVKEDLLTKMNFSRYQKDLILNAEHMDLFSYLCRFDFVYDAKEDTYKCIEFNAATPMGITESAISNSVINDYYQTKSPNHIEKGLVDMWDHIRKEKNIAPDEIIYFSSLKDHEEDRYNVEFQMNHAAHTGRVQFIALEDIQVNEDGLFDEKGHRINYWYKLFPVEFWEKEPHQFSNNLLKIVIEQSVTLINPIDAFFAQNKGFYAWVWSLAEDKEALITDQARQTIKKHMLPTYFEKPQSFKDYVVKPIFGREGNCVDIYKNNHLLFKDEEHEATHYYDQQPKIYQQYIEMPELTVETWDGPYTGKWLIGSYMIGGVSCGLYHRVGHIVTGSQSLYIPYTTY